MGIGDKFRGFLDRIKSKLPGKGNLPDPPTRDTQQTEMPDPERTRTLVEKTKTFIGTLANMKPGGAKTTKLRPSRETLANIRDALANVSFERIPSDFKLSKNALTYINIATVVACSYFAADLAATIVAPFIPEAEVKKAPRSVAKPKGIEQYSQPIYSRNLFNKDKRIPETDDFTPSLDGPAVKSSLPLDLLGIILVEDRLKSVASVQDKTRNEVVAVRVNDPITPQAIVQEIEAGRIIFYNKKSGRKEYIDLPEELGKNAPPLRTSKATGSGIQKVADNHIVVDREEVDKALGNLNQVLTQARCVPNVENGRPAGYRCFQIVPGSIYDKIGMKNGDVICGINGQEITDAGQAFELFNQLKSASTLELCIKRNRQVKNITYDIR